MNEIEGIAAPARGKWEVGDRVAVTVGEWKGMYGKIVRISGCRPDCIERCRVVWMIPSGGVPEGREQYLYQSRPPIFPDRYQGFRVSELTHVD